MRRTLLLLIVVILGCSPHASFVTPRKRVTFSDRLATGAKSRPATGTAQFLVAEFQVPSSKKDLLDRLWLYVDEELTEGRVDLIRKNGVRVGVTSRAFRPEADEPLKELAKYRKGRRLLALKSGEMGQFFEAPLPTGIQVHLPEGEPQATPEQEPATEETGTVSLQLRPDSGIGTNTLTTSIGLNVVAAPESGYSSGTLWVKAYVPKGESLVVGEINESAGTLGSVLAKLRDNEEFVKFFLVTPFRISPGNYGETLELPSSNFE